MCQVLCWEWGTEGSKGGVPALRIQGGSDSQDAASFKVDVAGAALQAGGAGDSGRREPTAGDQLLDHRAAAGPELCPGLQSPA